jgi:hypothetical protein
VINIRLLYGLLTALLWLFYGNNIFDFDAQYAIFGGKFLEPKMRKKIGLIKKELLKTTTALQKGF